MSESPSEYDFNVEEVSPLRVLAFEAHEIYKELLFSGFSEKAAGQIMGSMLYDAISSVGTHPDEDDEEEDEENVDDT